MFYEADVEAVAINNPKVTDMRYMFYFSQAESLDLSFFDTSNVTDMYWMFSYAEATTGYARTQVDADRLNSSSGKPGDLNFMVRSDL